MQSMAMWSDMHVLSLVGAFLQALLALLSAATLTMTRRSSPLRSGGYWVQAQVALLAAVVAALLWNLASVNGDPLVPLMRVLAGIYLAGKLGFFAAVLFGTVELLGGVPRRPVRQAALAVMIVAALSAALVPVQLQPTMPVQGLIGMLVMGWCAVMLFRARPPFRTVGSTLLGVTTTFYALLGLAYFLGWRYGGGIASGDVFQRAMNVIDHGSVPDLFAQLLMAVTTVALLFEQQREVTRRTGAQQRALHAEAVTTERLETLGRVAATVAHELNNPLSVVLGTAEHLLATDPPPQMRDDLQLMWREAMRCRHVARELLLVSRDQRPERAPCDAMAIVRDAAASVRLQAAAAGVQLVVKSGPSFTLSAEEIALEQVLINLLRNAIDATPRGRLVTISATVQHDEACFVVEDEGSGMDSDVRTRLDELFFSTKAPGEGTGLGLSIVRGIVARHGGSLHVESTPERRVGSCFTVRLPLHDVRAVRSGTSLPVRRPTDEFRLSPSSVPAVALEAQHARHPVLVIDDEVGIRRVLARLLARHGVAVELASDGIEARERIASQPLAAWTAIFCDVRMPREDGLTFTGWLETSHPSLLSRLVLLTGDTVSEGVTAVASRTGCQLMAKPFRQQDVDEMLVRVAS